MGGIQVGGGGGSGGGSGVPTADFYALEARVTALESRPFDVEAAQDAAAALFGTVGVYDDAANTYTLTLPSPRTDEEIQDVVAALLRAGANVSVTYDDAGNALTVNASAAGLTAVAHDNSLVGAGTSGDLLKVPVRTFTPAAMGYRGWTTAPETCNATRALNNGTLYLGASIVNTALASGTVLNLEHQVVGTAGATFTAALIGLYLYDTGTGTATLVGQSGDLAAVWNSTGGKTTAITLTAAIPSGAWLYVGALANASTAPALLGAAVPSAGIGRGTPVRWGSVVTGSTLPASVTPAGLTAHTPIIFFTF